MSMLLVLLVRFTTDRCSFVIVVVVVVAVTVIVVGSNDGGQDSQGGNRSHRGRQGQACSLGQDVVHTLSVSGTAAVAPCLFFADAASATAANCCYFS